MGETGHRDTGRTAGRQAGRQGGKTRQVGRRAGGKNKEMVGMLIEGEGGMREDRQDGAGRGRGDVGLGREMDEDRGTTRTSFQEGRRSRSTTHTDVLETEIERWGFREMEGLGYEIEIGILG